MRISRHFTTAGTDAYDGIGFEERESHIVNPDGSSVFEATGLFMPEGWSQVAVDIMAQKYFRKAGVPSVLRRVEEDGVPQWLWRSEADPTSDETTGEVDSRQIFRRLAGTWTYWAWKQDYFDAEEDAQAFYDELSYMMATQRAAPNSPQWFNTGLHWAYGIAGPSQGHWYVPAEGGEPLRSTSAYERPQPHACFIQSVSDDLVNEGGIMDLWTREARIFKYGSGTGSNFSQLRGEDEPLSGGGKSSGLMSFLKIGDRAAGAIKSGGTTRRAAKMVIVDVDHPDVEKFIDWKVTEEDKVATMVTGSRVMRKHLRATFEATADGLDLASNRPLRRSLSRARRDGVPESYLQRVLQLAEQNAPTLDLTEFDTDWQGEAYQSVSGQNANNSVRVTSEFLDAVKEQKDWDLIRRTDGSVHRTVPAADIWNRIARAAWQSADPGIQYDTTINEWHTAPAQGRINGSNPCSEYMFLDDTACNLASINLLKFVDDGDFNIEAYEHATRLWTVVLETSVLMAQFPSREIALRSYDYRTLGLGYANLGAMLMVEGIPYDSPESLAWTGALTAILTGVSYSTSAEMAAELGAFPRYDENREAMLRVIRNHRRAAYGVEATEYEDLTVLPVPIDEAFCREDLLTAARDSWDRALELGETHGYRNAQTSLIAPTGTIGLLMDCDTTGVEPDFALVKFKKLAGGGYFRIINGSVPAALAKLGYGREQATAIVEYCVGSAVLEGSPHINRYSMAERGFTQPVLDTIDGQLSTAFHLSFAFNRYVLGDDFCRETLGLSDEQLNDPMFDLLGSLGFTPEQVEEANDHILGRMTLEGAPHLREEHYTVFDCATKTGKYGTRFIEPMAHVRTLSAAQPFISGAISKTINMPSEATIDDVRAVYNAAASGMVKALALYRDGSKLSQPLSAAFSDALTEDDEETLDEAFAEAAAAAGGSDHPAVSEAERIIRALPVAEQIRLLELFGASNEADEDARKRLPSRRQGYGQKARVGGHAIYLHTGQFDDGRLGEIFISMAKDGAAFRSLMNCFAIAVSIGLQHGVPLEAFVDSFVFTKFEPNGLVNGHDRIQMATSIIDYVFRELAISYLGRDDLAHIGAADVSDSNTDDELENELVDAISMSPGVVDTSDDATIDVTDVEAPAAPALVAGTPAPRFGASANVAPASAAPAPAVEPTPAAPPVVTSPVAAATAAAPSTNRAAATVTTAATAPVVTLTAEMARQRGFEGDPCDECGLMMMVRNGTCLKCVNCGVTTGCS